MLGQVDTYSTSLITHSLNFSLRVNRIGNPQIVKLYTVSFNATDMLHNIDYMPTENLGYLSAALIDNSWLSETRLFAHISSAKADSIALHIDAHSLPSGFYSGGITTFYSSPLGMDSRFIPIRFDYVSTNIEEQPAIPKKFAVGQNYPNPFNPSTTIPVALPRQSVVTAKIFNILGQEVYSTQKTLPPGNHVLVWDGKISSENQAPSGIYFYRVSDGKESILKKMVLVR